MQGTRPNQVGTGVVINAEIGTVLPSTGLFPSPIVPLSTTVTAYGVTPEESLGHQTNTEIQSLRSLQSGIRAAEDGNANPSGDDLFHII